MVALAGMLSVFLLLLAGMLAVAAGLAARLEPGTDQRPPDSRLERRLAAFYLAAKGTLGGLFLVHGLARLFAALLDGLMTGRVFGAAPLTVGLTLLGLLLLAAIGALFLRDLLSVALSRGSLPGEARPPSRLQLPLGLASLGTGLLLLAIGSLQVIV